MESAGAAGPPPSAGGPQGAGGTGGSGSTSVSKKKRRRKKKNRKGGGTTSKSESKTGPSDSTSGKTSVKLNGLHNEKSGTVAGRGAAAREGEGAKQSPLLTLPLPSQVNQSSSALVSNSTSRRRSADSGPSSHRKPYVCSECSKEFDHKVQLEAHMPYHADTLGINDCDNSTISAVNPPARPHKCSDCVASFQYQYQLRTHSRLHTGEKPFTCKHCSERFNENGSLKLHILEHDVEQRQKFGCSECEKVFAHRPLLINHLKMHNGVAPFQCHHCDRRYTQLDILQKHIVTHSAPPVNRPHSTGPSPSTSLTTRLEPSGSFHCDKCPESFSNQGSLDVHKLLHTVEGKSTTLNSLGENSQENHKILSAGSASLAQPDSQPGSSPANSQEDSKHELPTQNGKHGNKFECAHCTQHFEESELLKQHVRSDHSTQSYKCRKCESRFTEQASFLQHQRNHT